MTADDTLHGGQAHTASGEFGFRVKPLKGAEEPVRQTRIESRAIVTNEIDSSLPLVFRSEFDSGRIASFRIFPGVLQQVLQSDLQETSVALCWGNIGDHEVHIASGIAAAHIEGNGAGQRRHVNRVAVKRNRGYAR